MRLIGVCIITNDVPRLVAFYTTVLQMEPEGDDIHSAFNVAQLAIYNPGVVQITRDKNMALMYFVDDVDAEYARLAALGIENLVEPTVKPWGVKSFVFHDPDGNQVSFVQEPGNT